MEFVKAMRIMNRMCNSVDCRKCSVVLSNNGEQIICPEFFMDFPEKAEEILTKWNAEHPLKTLKDVFDDMFPDARRLDNGIPYVCVISLGYERRVALNDCCNSNCIKCWSQPYEEPEK